MTSDPKNSLHIYIEEITEDEFIIVVKLQDKQIAGLYMRGDRQYANEFLKIARGRILLTLVGEEPDGTHGRILQELM